MIDDRPVNIRPGRQRIPNLASMIALTRADAAQGRFPTPWPWRPRGSGLPFWHRYRQRYRDSIAW